jgi:two-component system, cell cycle response regulator DivK
LGRAEESVQTTVLLVEDNEFNQRLMSFWFQRMKFRSALATTGGEALRVAEALQPDIVLMDMSLPDLDGWEATRQLRANPSTEKIPVIALTAYAMAGDRERALDAGCDDYLTKPVDFAELLTRMKRLLPTPGPQ